jgi:hypothetical protein
MGRILKLDEVKLSKREEDTLTDIMSNLPKMRKALALELRTKRRPATIARLAGRFKTLLEREVDIELGGGA